MLHLITLSDTHTFDRTVLDEGQHTILTRDGLSCHWQDSNRAATGIGPCTITCTNAQLKEFRVQREVFELESGYRTRSVNRDLKYSNGSVATR